MSNELDNHKPRGITFDKTINLGHVLTFLGFVITGMVAWSTLDKRVVVLEESRKAQAQIDRHQDEVLGQNMTTIREALGEIKRSVERVEDRLERKK
ncbi:MAG: hypothetical protein AB7P94_16720 [Steroidobacteraceae bacterium]